MLALHLATGLPLLALALWFGVIDRVPAGEGRCPSCGVEPYIIAAHVVAALWLGATIAAIDAARRRSVGPGRRTRIALAGAAILIAVALVWHPLFNVPALAAMVVSIVLAPAAAVWWLLRTVAWARRPAVPDELRASLVAAWIALGVLLPGLFGWVWTDRVDWLVF